MQTNPVSIQRIAAFVILIFLGVYLLVLGQSILTALAFGALFALMLKPVCAFYERKLWRIPSIILSLITAAIPLVGLFYFFSTQLVNVFEDMPSIQEKLSNGVEVIYDWIGNKFGYSEAETDTLLKEQLPKILNGPMSGIGGGFLSSAVFLVNFFLTLIYTFLFLLYRSAFKQFVIMQAPAIHKEKTATLLNKIQKVVQQYLYGLFLVIIIVGVLNTIGLTVIGIEHALFWGFLGSMLAIIPYVGSFLGGFLPFLYALATTDQMWQPFAIVAWFVFVQIMEGNLITPNVVGSSIKVNALAAIVALLVGGRIWGIAGMVLSLPAIAILKEILKQSDYWRPVGYLMSDEIANNDHVFKVKWDKERFRLRNFFKGPKKT
jgi:predicted PurR-regulated permease PerM